MESSSEDEEPVNISFKSAKISAQDEIEKIRESVNMKKERILSKRRQHEELLREQKRTSTSKKEEQSGPEERAIVSSTSTLLLSPGGTLSAKPETKELKRKRSTRNFPSIGISVQSLNSVSNSRGASLLDFKSKRLAKAHREPIRNIISYKEKLAAKNK